MRIVGTLTALFAIAGAASADHCRARVVQQNYVAPYVAPVIPIATYVPVPVAVPQYSVGYNADGDTALAIREQTEVLKKFFAEMRAGVGTPSKPTEPENSATSRVLAVMTTKCAKCHNEANYKDKGGNHLLVKADGTLADNLDWETIRDEVETGRMPKGGPELPEDEYRVFVEKQREQLKVKKDEKRSKKAEAGY